MFSESSMNSGDEINMVHSPVLQKEEVTAANAPSSPLPLPSPGA